MSANSNIILSGDAYSNFIETIKSDATKFLYQYGLVQFMKFLNITDVDNLIVLAQDPKGLQQKIVEYIKFMRERKKVSVSTIDGYLSSVMHFYAMNDVSLNRKRIGRYIPEHVRKQKDRAYTIEEISKLLEFCDLRNRAIVLLFASTGMRIGAIPFLTHANLTKIEKYSLYQITVYECYSEEYICFCTPECAKAIDDYLAHRTRCGEKLTPKSPLFRQQFNTDNGLDEIYEVKPIVISTIRKALTRALHLSGVMPVSPLREGVKRSASENRKVVMKSHGFRKFVNTQMINCRLDSSIRNKLLGHSIALDKSYWRPQTQDLLQEYLKVLDALTINEENRLKRKVQELEIDQDKLDMMQKKLEDLYKKFG